MLIRDTLERTSRHRSVEGELFEVVGRWAGEEDDPGLTRVLAAQARHHAWRATMWDALVPVLHDVPAPDTGLGDLRSTLESPSVPALAGVLEGLIADYEADLATATEVSDAPVARVLQLVLLDTRADLDALRSLG